MKQSPRSFIEGYIHEAAKVAGSLERLTGPIEQASESLLAVIRGGGRIYTCGNGGSACDAMHFAEELVARYLRERPGIPAQHLIDSGTMTCWANDYDFNSVFSRQVETLMSDKDALVGFSTSGNSPNVLAAVKAANEKGGFSLALSGKGGGLLKGVAKQSIIVESDITSHIQEAHIKIVHILCDLLEQQLYPTA